MNKNEFMMWVGGILLGMGLGGIVVALIYLTASPSRFDLDPDTLQVFAACLVDEATEQCHLERNPYGYEVIWRMKGE